MCVCVCVCVKSERFFRLSPYGILSPPNTFYGSKCNRSEDNGGVLMNLSS